MSSTTATSTATTASRATASSSAFPVNPSFTSSKVDGMCSISISLQSSSQCKSPERSLEGRVNKSDDESEDRTPRPPRNLTREERLSSVLPKQIQAQAAQLTSTQVATYQAVLTGRMESATASKIAYCVGQRGGDFALSPKQKKTIGLITVVGGAGGAIMSL